MIAAAVMQKSQCGSVSGSTSHSRWHFRGRQPHPSRATHPHGAAAPVGAGLEHCHTLRCQERSWPRLGCGECCVYQASRGMLSLQDNGFLGSQKNLNSLPRWKIVPFHPLYN